MNVYLLPLGGSHHELYCEVAPDDVDLVEDQDGTSWWARQRRRFRSMLAEAEDEQVQRERGHAPERGGIARVVVRKIAEGIAEQRLLWRLRRAPGARLVHPDGMEGAAALALARELFLADFKKHRRWCAIDAVIALITGPVFFFVPGPNLVAYYFVFRAIGHFLALQGANRGLRGVEWETDQSVHLSTLGRIASLPSDERRPQLDDIADALHLEKLTPFVERVVRRDA